MITLFPKRPPRERASQPSGADWGQQEIAEFYRAQHLLQQSGIALGLDRGLTDKGEPWLVFYDPGSQEVFVHIARIGNQCILASEVVGLRLEAPTISELIPLFEVAMRETIENRAARSNVVMLPTARVLLSIAVLIVLAKLQMGDAEAAPLGGVEEDTYHGRDDYESASRDVFGGHDDVWRKSTLQSRLQNFIQRATDLADSPVAIAAAAHLLIVGLAWEQTSDERSEIIYNADDETSIAALLAFNLEPRRDVEADQKSGGEPEPQPVNHDLLVRDAEFPRTDIAVQPAARVQAVYQTDQQIVASNSGDVRELSEPDTIRSEALIDFFWKSSVNSLPNQGARYMNEVVLPNTTPIAQHAEVAKIESVEAIKLLNHLLSTRDPPQSLVIEADGGELKIATQGSSNEAPVSVAKPTPADARPQQSNNPTGHPANVADNSDSGVVWLGGKSNELDSISFSSLEMITSRAGYVRSTHVEPQDLDFALRHVMIAFRQSEIEISGGNVLVEQVKAEGLSPAELGVWTNTMADGSRLIIVGTADLVESFKHFAIG